MRLGNCALMVALCACNGTNDGTDDTLIEDSDTDLPEPSWPSEIAFEVRAGDAVVGCATEIQDVGTPAREVDLLDLRLFLSGLSVKGPGGSAPIVPTQDGQFQYADVVMLDFADGTGRCLEASAATHTVVRGSIPEGDWDTLVFDVGVPFGQNHLPAASSEPPLDDVSMFLTRQTGHLFARIDLDTRLTPPANAWSLRLASGGCTSDSADDAPETPCDRPNLPHVEVPWDGLTNPTIVLDLDALLLGVDLGANTLSTPPGCQVSPSETTDCAPIFSAFGMRFNSGACEDGCSSQTAFRSE